MNENTTPGAPEGSEDDGDLNYNPHGIVEVGSSKVIVPPETLSLIEAERQNPDKKGEGSLEGEDFETAFAKDPADKPPTP